MFHVSVGPFSTLTVGETAEKMGPTNPARDNKAVYKHPYRWRVEIKTRKTRNSIPKAAIIKPNHR
jgi:hypothetical protein